MAAPTPPKSMSSRLLTMKFMQRAAASPSSSPATPQSDEQSSKRRKTSHDTSSNVKTEPLVDSQAIQAAIEEEERKRQAAVLKNAEAAGDARWVLDLPQSSINQKTRTQAPLNVVQVGFAQLDRKENLDEPSSPPSRTSAVRRFNMDKKKASNESDSDSDDSGSDSESDSDSRDESGSAGRNSQRSSRGGGSQTPSRGHSSTNGLQAKRSAEKAKAAELAGKRRKREVKLNSAKSSFSTGISMSASGGISSGGGSSFSPSAHQRQSSPIICHRCQQPGHIASRCKNTPKK